MKDIRYDGKPDFTLSKVGYVKVMRDKDFTVPYKSGKEMYSIILPQSGSMSYSFPNTKETIMLFPGDMIFIPRKCPYTATYLQKDTVMNLFIFFADGSILPEYTDRPLKRTAPEVSQNIMLSLSGNTNSTLFLAAKIYEIISVLEGGHAPVDKNYKKILPAINAFGERYYENFKLSRYAELCDMSESNFRRLFREVTGKSPIEYRNAIRISQVQRMLDSGEYTVTEAAYAAGFNNMSFFYEVYNRLAANTKPKTR